MFLAIRDLRYSPLKYAMMAVIMVLISLLVLFVTGLAQGLSYDNASAIKNSPAKGYILQKGADNRFSRSVLPERTLTQAMKEAGASNTAPLHVHMGAIVKKGTHHKMDATFFGVRPGSFIAPENMTGAVAAISLKKEGLEAGDTIIDEASGKEYKITDFIEDRSFSHTPVIYVPFEETEGLSAVALKKVPDNLSIEGTEVVSKGTALKSIPGFKEEQGSLIMMIVFLFIIAAFVLAVFFYVMTLQKTHQFGVLKAIGVRAGYLAKNVILQMLIISSVSLIISLLLIFVITALLPASIPFILTPAIVISSMLLFLAVALAGSLVSVWRVIKINALDAIGGAA